jgi:hypothetical protein
VKVTRIAYSRGLTAGKYGQLVEQARRLGRVRSLVWDRYGSITGVGLSVWHADHAAAINILDRAADADIGLYTPHRRVKQLIQDRADRPRSRLPDQDSNTTDHRRCGERNIQSRSTPIKE